MSSIGERIMTRVERQFDANKNHFYARGVMSRIALVLTDHEYETILDTNERTVRFLAERRADGFVFANIQNLGNNDEASTDFVLVTHRDGKRTLIEDRVDLSNIVIRATTDDIDY